jgi:hypothetical protein
VAHCQGIDVPRTLHPQPMPDVQYKSVAVTGSQGESGREQSETKVPLGEAQSGRPVTGLWAA